MLLDYVKQLRKKGHDVTDALVRAGLIRFRPVILTAITTILGLIPMAVGIAMEIVTVNVGPIPIPYIRLLFSGQSAAWWGPMAVAVIFGLAFATILTLIMVPTLYSIVHDVTRLWQWMKRRSAPAAAAASVGLIGIAIAPLDSAEAITLEDAWTAALENNADLRALNEQAEEARIQRMLTWGYITPTVGHASYTFNQYDAELNMADAFAPLLDMLRPAKNLTLVSPSSFSPNAFSWADSPSVNPCSTHRQPQHS